MSKLQNKIEWLLLSLIIFAPRLFNLDVFLTADEPLFLEHSQEFAQAFATGDFSLTTGIGYPGATVAGWTAPIINLAQTEMGQYTLGRIATATLVGLLLLLLYALSRQLLGRGPAFIGVALLAVDPYMLGYSRLFHIAAPLALFITLAGVALLLWLQTNRWLWLWLGGVFSGLALLTKSTALLLGPMLGCLILAWAIVTGQWRNLGWWRQKLGGSLLILLISTVIFWMLWPAMWVDPIGTLILTFGKLFIDQEAGAGNLGLFWFGQFVENPGPAFYPIAFLLKSTPWLLIGLTLSLYYLFNRPKLALSSYPPSPDSQSPVSNLQSPISQPPVSNLQSPISQSPNLQSPVSNLPISQSPPPNSQFSILNSQFLPLWLFALTYLIIMTIASKKSIRYMLPAFPTFYLLTGLAFHQTLLILQAKKQSLTPSPSPPSQRPTSSPQSPISNLQSPISLLLLTLSLSLTLFYHPYYLTYYNPLLLGWRWAPQTLLVGWGEGLDGAANYLNDQPEQTVSAWYEWLFPLLYNGRVEAVVPQEQLITADSTVLYINQVQRDIPSPNIIHYFRTRRQPEHTVRLNGIDYAWVYPGPIAGFQPFAAPQIPLGGDFGSEARLIGYDLDTQPPTSGEPFIITLQWQILTPPADNRFVYLRLVDAQGRIWATADGPLVMGLWPVERWQTGMFIEDAHELLIPAGTPPGTYRLEVGLYNPATGEPLTASGQPSGQGGGLLLGDISVEWQSQTETEIDLAHQADVALSNRVKLVGYDALPSAATTGDLLPTRLIWRETGGWFNRSNPNEKSIVFSWSREGDSLAEQLDSLPMSVEQWGRGGVLRSQHEVIVPPTLSAGRYNLLISLRDNQQHGGESFSLGEVDVTTPSHEFELPPEARSPLGSPQLTVSPDETITLAGYSHNFSDAALTLQLFWQTNAQLTSRYKVFAQLLDANSTLVAQSDSVPATGQRPTTGWLPNEIITDIHTLTLPLDLPSDQPYYLIVGLYDPITGQRLAFADKSGNNILVSEVELSRGQR